MNPISLLIAGSINPINFKLIIREGKSTFYSCTMMVTAIVTTAIKGKKDSVTKILNR